MKRTRRKASLFFTYVIMALILTVTLCPPAYAGGEYNPAFKNALDVSLDASADILYLEGMRDYGRAYEVLALVNQQRIAAGLNPLVMDVELLDAAMLRAAEIVIDFSHIRPTGESCFTASSKMNGENIAYGYTSASSVMDGWMNSSGHRANILNTRWQSIGIGCFYQENGRLNWVQVFGGNVADPAPGQTPTPVSIVTEKVYVEPGKYACTIREQNITLIEGKQQKLTITASAAFIHPKSFVWLSSDSDVATVDGTGIITAKSIGTLTVTGRTAKGNTVSTMITVTPAHAYVGSFTLKMRTYPHSSSAEVKTLKNGTRLEFYEKSGNWIRVKSSDGAEGWVASEFVCFSAYTLAAGNNAKVFPGTLILREEPKSASAVIKTLRRGETVRIIDNTSSKTWIKVDSGGNVGWVAASYIGKGI